MDEMLLGAGTGGAWTWADAAAAGITRAQARGRLARGEWQQVRRGVLTHGGVVPDARLRAWAAVLAGGGPDRARAAGRTAARVLGLPLVDDHDPLLAPSAREAAHDDVAVARGCHPSADLHRERLQLAPQDVARLDGLPTLTPVRVLIDLARLLTLEALVCAVDHALHVGLVSVPELTAAVRTRAGLPYADVLRRAVDLADGRAESPHESLTRLLLLPVLPGLVPQVLVRDRSGRPVARLDLGDERLRLGVEADGARWHRGDAALASDRRRERDVGAYGWHLERVTWADVRRDGPRTRARVLVAVDRLAA